MDNQIHQQDLAAVGPKQAQGASVRQKCGRKHDILREKKLRRTDPNRFFLAHVCSSFPCVFYHQREEVSGRGWYGLHDKMAKVSFLLRCILCAVAAQMGLPICGAAPWFL